MAKYKVTLTTDERNELTLITSQGKHSVRKIKRAQILLLSDLKNETDEMLAEQIDVSVSTVHRTRQSFVDHGLDVALHDDPRSGQPRKLDANQEALMIAMCCTEPPQGRCRWTLSMLGEQLITLTELDSISPETIRQRLKDNDLKPWQKKMWCIAKSDTTGQAGGLMSLTA